MMTLAPIFLNQNYLRHKYFDVCSLAVSLSIDIWVQQPAAAVKFPKNQLQFKQTVERMGIKLRGAS